MTKFNPENKKVLTCSEMLSPAMKIQSEKDAKQYFDKYVDFILLDMKDERIALNKLYKNDGNANVDLILRNKAESIAKANLGYWAGYYNDETRKRVEKLFMCSHPIFGSIEENGRPAGKESFECGKQRKTLKEIRNK